ncbi:hypothetical protein LR004_02495 [Candidatus Gracilibacteria bacterium]|nr:hypothetical protein [Candidatus Gracilibacteria bacterium]
MTQQINQILAKERCISFFKQGQNYYNKKEYLASFSITFFAFELYIKILFEFDSYTQKSYIDKFKGYLKGKDLDNIEKMDFPIPAKFKDIKSIKSVDNTGKFGRTIKIDDDYIDWLFQIRHNLFHGNKANYKKKDERLFEYGSKLIFEIMNKIN